jgi:hypothetical protein
MPWFRQDGETAIAYADFIHYLMLPTEERTYTNAARATGKSHSLMEKRGQQWSWRLRAAAYDEHYMLLKLESVEAERDRMFVEHRALTQTGLHLVEAHMKALIRKLQSEDGDPIDALMQAGYKPGDIVRLFKEIEKADRDLVLQRSENAAAAQEKIEKLTEAHAEELSSAYRELLDELNLTPEQEEIARNVVQRQLVGATLEEGS